MPKPPQIRKKGYPFFLIWGGLGISPTFPTFRKQKAPFPELWNKKKRVPFFSYLGGFGHVSDISKTKGSFFSAMTPLSRSQLKRATSTAPFLKGWGAGGEAKGVERTFLAAPALVLVLGTVLNESLLNGRNNQGQNSVQWLTHGVGDFPTEKQMLNKKRLRKKGYPPQAKAYKLAVHGNFKLRNKGYPSKILFVSYPAQGL